MSGFAGVVRLDGAPASRHTNDLAHAIAHRGSDARGEWSRGELTLVHALLRTTPEDVRQPVVDGDLVVVADVRLDNREDLGASLGNLRDESDAAFIAAAYRRWGTDCVRHLEGDFSFAIWDRPARTLFCARDPFGVKPFLYALMPGKLFAFGSALRAILAVDEVPDDLDDQRVAEFLTVWFEDHERTFHRAVKRLPGGHTLVLQDGALRISRYWFPREVGPLRLRGGDAAYAEGFLEHFRRAVRSRMRVSSPAELGALLSGGLDSSSIACVARDEIASAGGSPLPVFSWVFSDAMEADEREFQEAVAAEGGMRRIVLDSATFDAPLWTEVPAMLPDGPLYAPNAYLNLEIHRRAREDGVRTLLDGLGGDSIVSRGPGRFVELFLRARPFTLARELRAFGKRRGAGESLLKLFLAYVALPLTPAAIKDIADGLRRRPTTRDRLAVLSRSAAASMPRERYEAYLTAREEHVRQFESPFIAEGLELFDRMHAHMGVEGRYPFFDRRLAEYCLSLPADQKMSDGYSRIVARRALSGILPDIVRWRAGKGAPGLHVVPALRASQAHLDDLIVGDPSVLEPYVDIDVLRATYAQLLSGGKVDFRTVIALWSAAVLGMWLRERSTKTLSPANERG